MQVEGGHPWLQGIALAVLLSAFLRLERVERHGAVTALAVVVVAGLAAALAAPRLDVGRPLLDPEALANALAPDRGLQFSWNHDYGALHWPRTGREVLRVKAKTASYWKVENLSHFDGLRWVEPRELGPTEQEASMIASQRDWSSEIHVRVRAFSSRLFVGAGTTLAISSSPRTPIRNAPGTFRTGPRPLHEGQSYDATVWYPRPTKRQLRSAKGELPAWTWPYLRIDLPHAQGGPVLRPPSGSVLTAPQTAQVSFPGYAIHSPPFVERWPGQAPVEVEDELRRSAYGGVYRLAERLRQGTTTRLRVRPARARPPRARRLPVLGGAAAQRRPARVVPAQRQTGLLPAVLRGDGAPAADGGRARPGGDRLLAGHDRPRHRRVRRARHRRALLGRGVHRPLRLGHLRPHAAGRPGAADPGVGAAASAYALAAPAGVLGARRARRRPRPRRRQGRTAARRCRGSSPASSRSSSS